MSNDRRSVSWVGSPPHLQRNFTVHVLEHPGKKKVILLAYLGGPPPKGCKHVVCAVSAVESKRIAKAQHRKRCMTGASDG